MVIASYKYQHKDYNFNEGKLMVYLKLYLAAEIVN